MEEKIMYYCKDCGEVIDIETGNYFGQIEDDNGIVCVSCFTQLDSPWYVCDECGTLINKEEDAYESDGSIIVCEECFNESYARCKDCDELIHTSRDQYISNDDETEYVCMYCQNHNDWKYCEDCGCLTQEYTYIDNRNKYVCSNCRENYAFCEECEEYVDEDNIYYMECTDRYVCGGCRNDNYHECEHCGDYVHEDDVVYGNSGNPYCSERCMELEDDYEHDDDDGRPAGTSCIASYQKTNAIEFLSTDHDSWEDLYFGIELEMEDTNDRDGYELEEVAEIARETMFDNGAGVWVTKHDGSLDNGFELTSASVFSFEYFNEIAFPGIKKTLDKMISLGMVSDKSSNCGLHIHASKKAMTPNTIVSTVQLMDMYWESIMQPVSRRRGRFSYAGRPYMESFIVKKKDQNIERLRSSIAVDYEGPLWYSGMEYYIPDIYDLLNKANSIQGHGVALNVGENYNTMELRLFRGTLNSESFKAAVHFYRAMLEYASKNPWEKITMGNQSDFLDYLLDFSPCLRTYIGNRFRIERAKQNMNVPEISNEDFSEIVA